MNKLFLSTLILICISTASAFTPWERDQKFLEAIKLSSAEKYDLALPIYYELEQDGYGKDNPLLYFRIGDLYRKKSKSSNDPEELTKAESYLMKSKAAFETRPKRDEYKSTIISLAYTYIIQAKYSSAVSVVNDFLSQAPNDPEGKKCLAYAYNGWGFDFYQRGIYSTAIKYFSLAYEAKKTALIANNLINAHIYNSRENIGRNSKIAHIEGALIIFNEQKNTSEWKDPSTGYTPTGETLRIYLKKYEIKENEKKIIPTSSPTPTPTQNWLIRVIKNVF